MPSYHSSGQEGIIRVHPCCYPLLSAMKKPSSHRPFVHRPSPANSGTVVLVTPLAGRKNDQIGRVEAYL